MRSSRPINHDTIEMISSEPGFFNSISDRQSNNNTSRNYRHSTLIANLDTAEISDN